jgi:outer membrane murein-binding lipoprotein Lpp
MNRTPAIALIVLAGFVAAWGCGQTPTASTGTNKSLEQRVAKLEQDLKAVEKDRDAAKANAAAAEEKLRAQAAHAQAVEKERDALAIGLKARTAEKDEAVAKLDTFKKGLKDLLGDMEKTTAAPPANPGATSSVLASPRGL